MDKPAYDLKQRTFEYARRVVRVCSALPKNSTSWVIGKQLLRSGTSVGANYREADRGRSEAEFTAILGICLRDLAETEYWLQLIQAEELLAPSKLESLLKETDELLAIFYSIRNKASHPKPKDES